MPSRINEVQLEAFRDELRKEASKWYARAGQSLGNFAKRQAHSVTGWTPKGFMNPEGIREIGAGSAPARKALDAAIEGKRGIRQAGESLRANRRAEELGLTSLPGYAKALWNPETRGQVLPAALNQQLKGSGKLERMVTLGLPAADLAGELVSKEDPENPDKGQRLGRAIAGTATGLVTGSLPFTGGLIAGASAGALGGAVGHGIDKLRARRRLPPQDIHTQAPPNPEDSRGQSGSPVERNMSPSAMGQAPDWSGA